MGPVFAVIGAVATVAGTAISYNAQKKAARAQDAQQALANTRSNKQAIRQMQLQRAQAMSAASMLGAAGGSSSSGGLSSLSSQLGSGLGYGSQMSGLSAQISKQLTRASIGSSIAGIGGTAFQLGGGFDGLKSWWDTSNMKPKPANSRPHSEQF